MFGYPLFLNLKGQRCLVFGGGEVAERKIRTLLKRGAMVTCISKDFCKSLKRLVRVRSPRPKGGGTPPLQLKRIKNGQINVSDAWLAIIATSDRNFNAHIARICRKKKIWVNAVDDPELCDFYAPAVLERGPLQIAISTGGASPLFAKRLREELEKVIPVSTGKLLEKIGKMRRKLLS